MKSIMILLSVSVLSIYMGLSLEKLNAFFDKADSFFSISVSDGLVEYSSVNKVKLDELVSIIGETNLSDARGEQKKTFYINAYNILVIKQVVDNYPISSPMKVDGFFDKTKFKVAGEELTLNGIENDIIRKLYSDARIHFVLVCAAMSCPPITSTAYKPLRLDVALDEQTIKALNNDNFIKVDNAKKEVQISEIFKWYNTDFLKDHEDILEYINEYRAKKIPADYKVSYYSYDWDLNQK